jgi:hypothetical protein
MGMVWMMQLKKESVSLASSFNSMKHITKSVLVSCSLLAGVSYFALRANHESQMTDLAFENVEALAQGEDGDSVYCVGDGEVDCRDVKVEVKYTGLR